MEVDAPKGIWQSDNKKKRKTIKRQKKTKQEIGHNFLIDFLFFIPHDKSVYILEKMDRPQNWLEMIGWKAFWLKK